MPIFHLATLADWEAAQASGRYTISTRGRTLAEEGFIHASRADQWQGVRDRYYADETEPLVLLVIDPDLLTAPVVDEHVPGTDETFPHVYGAIEPGAVVRVLPLGTTSYEPVSRPMVASVDQPTPAAAAPAAGANTAVAAPESFFSLFLREAGFRAGIVLVVLVLAVALGLVAQNVWGDVTALVVMLGVLALGLVAGAVVLRRRDRRYRAAHPRTG